MTSLVLLLASSFALSPAYAADGKKKGKKKKGPKHALVSGELPGTAHTLSQGKGAVHLTGQSGYGLSDQTELKTSLYGLIAGPNLGVEQSLMQGGGKALSLQLNAASNWAFNTQAATLGGVYSIGGPQVNRINLGLGVGVSTSNVDKTRTNAFNTNLMGGYDIVLDPKSVVQLSLNVDPYNSAQSSSFVGTAGGTWNHGWKNLRLGLGLYITPAGVASLNTALADNDQTLVWPTYAPLPWIDLWWKF